MNQTYHFRAKAVGNGTALGNDMTFELMPPGFASSITTNSATLCGNVLLNEHITTNYIASFEYGPTINYDKKTNDATVNSFTGNYGIVTANITGLIPGQTYHFRTKLTGNTITYSIDQTFITFSNPAIAPSIDTGTVSNISATCVTLNGTLAAMGTATEVVTSFDVWADGSMAPAIEMFPNSSGDGGGGGGGGGGFGWGWGGRGPMKSPGAYSDDIKGLIPGTLYHYRSKAVGDGTFYGIERTFTTLVSAVAPSLTINPPDTTTSNPVTLSGNLVDMGSAKTVITGLYYSYYNPYSHYGIGGGGPVQIMT